jgi:hypothetical protein
VRLADVCRVITGGDDEDEARDVWHRWPDSYRRSVALLVDKIHHEGWLDVVGQMEPWDGGCFFKPIDSRRGSLTDVLAAKARDERTYIESRLRNGLIARLNSLQHKGWVRSWMETDEELAALHVGLFANGMAEAHFDTFNPLFLLGAQQGHLIRLPLLGAFNLRAFLLHYRWELSPHAATARRSANFYHLMRGRVPLCF